MLFLGLFFYAANTSATASAVEVKTAEFVAQFYHADLTDDRPVVLVLGGSEGGLPDKLAQPIANAGYKVLSLAYFKAPKLPEELEKIPLEYFDAAINWLATHTDLQANGLTVVGWSKGAELSLLLASRDERINRVVAIAPSSVVWAGILKDWTQTPGSSWTLQGDELTHVPFRPSGEVTGLLDLYTQSLQNRADGGQADIPVENIKAQVSLMTGADDDIWPSPQMAESICQRMSKQRSGSCNHLNYPRLDHLLGYQFLDESTPMYSEFMALLAGSGS